MHLWPQWRLRKRRSPWCTATGEEPTLVIEEPVRLKGLAAVQPPAKEQTHMPTVPVCEAAIVAVAADTTGKQGRLVGPLLSIEELNDMVPTQDAQLNTIALRWFRDTSEGEGDKRFDPAVKLIDLSLTRSHMIGAIGTDNAGEDYSWTTNEKTGQWVRQVLASNVC